MEICFEKADFVLSAASQKQFIKDGLPQIAFAGRSNVGKSSVLNRLVGRKNLAHVGATPGKTTQINYFKIDGKLYFVDLPGYGYAKVAKSEKDRWGKLMESYFRASGLISAGVLIVDSRHKPTADDLTMYRFFQEAELPTIVVANKLDKLKKSEMQEHLDLIRQTLSMDEQDFLVPFSAQSGIGKSQLLTLLLTVLKK